MIASTIDTLHNTINGYEIACIWNSKYNVHVRVIQTNADFIFQKLIGFIDDENLAKQLLSQSKNYKIEICPSCFVYDLPNTIFVP